MYQIENEPSQSYQQIIGDSPTYVSYKRRWYILATLAVLNLSSAVQWLSFAPIAYKAADFYATNVSVINMISAVFMMALVPAGLCAMWILDTFDLKLSIIFSAWLNFIGSGIRIVSAIPEVQEEARLPLVFFGSALVALAQPFFLFASTKLAAVWFPDDERATANMIATMSNLFGIMLTGILSPVLVPEKERILFMLCIESVPAALAVAMATIGVCSSKPPTPPSASAEAPSQSFLVSIKSLLKNKAYWLLVLSIGCGIGLFCAMTTVLSQILCPWGYDSNFSGVVCNSALIGGGIVGAILASIIADKTRKHTEIAKICLVLSTLALISFAVMHSYRDLAAPIAVSLGVFGFFALPVYPIGNELCVETTYPVGEATSSGILMMVGQLQGILLLVLFSSLGKELPSDFLGEVCNTSDSALTIYDMAIPLYIMTGVAIVVMLVFVLTFVTRYRRLDAENSHAPSFREDLDS